MTNYFFWKCLLHTIGETVRGGGLARLGWDVEVLVLHHFQLVENELVRPLKLAVHMHSRISWKDEKFRVIDKSQIPKIRIEPNVNGILIDIFPKVIRTLIHSAETSFTEGKVRSPILLDNNLFLFREMKALSLALVFDNFAQIKTLSFDAADNVFTLSAIAKMPNNIVAGFQVQCLVFQP